MVALQAKFKKDNQENDGLERLAQELVTRPYERRVVIGIIRPVRAVVNHLDGTTQTTVRFDHIEVPLPEDAKAVLEILGAAYEERTGNPMPPESLFDRERLDDGPDDEDEAEGDPVIPGLDFSGPIAD